MPDKTLQVKLTAQDNLSGVFAKAGSSATKLSAALEQTGSAGKAAARDLDQTSKSAEDMQRRMADAYKGGQQLGVGLLATGAASVAAGKMFRDQQIAIDTLRRGYGDAADDLLQFADAMQQTTNFSNDAIIATENTFRTLSENYGFTADQIKELTRVSADLAASMGIGIEDAAMRIQSAMRGEAEAAEYLGLTLNDRALGLDRVSASMSEAERSQVRYNALLEQSAFAQGVAAQQADTTYGAVLNLAHGVQDVAQSYGGALGPIGEFGALLADHPMQVIATVAALKSLQVGLQGVITTYRAMQGVNLLSVAGGGLSGLVGLLTGPAGIIAAAGAAAVGIGLLGRSLLSDLPSASAQAVQSLNDVKNAAIDLGITGSAIAAMQQAEARAAANSALVNDYRDSLLDLNIVLGELGERMPLGGEEPMFDIDAGVFDELREAMVTIDGVQMSLADFADQNKDTSLTVTELRTAIATLGAAGYDVQPLEMALATLIGMNPALDTLADTLDGIDINDAMFDSLRDLTVIVDGVESSFLSWIDTNEDSLISIEELRAGIGAYSSAANDAADMNAAFAAAQTEMNAILAATGPHAEDARASLTALILSMLSGQTPAEFFADGVHGLALYLDLAKTSAAAATEEVGLFGKVTARMGGDLASVVESLGEGAYKFLFFGEGAAKATEEVGLFGRVTGQMVGDVASVVESLGEGAYRFLMFGEGASKAARELGVFAQITGRMASGAAATVADLAGSIYEPILSGSMELEAANNALAASYQSLAQAFTAPLTALQDGYRIAISNTDAIKQASQQVTDWAENMIKARGEWSRLDELTEKGLIQGKSGVFDDGSQYANIQNAYDAMALYNQAIQDNVDAVQLQQAPALAAMQENLADYTNWLATEATPEQQAFALAMMDSATQAQAFDLAQGLIENRDVFGPMAESLANLNPYLGEALVQMGLMEKTYDESSGTYVYTLRVDGGDTALSQTQELTRALDGLNKTFTAVFNLEANFEWGDLSGLGERLNPFSSGGGGAQPMSIEIPVTANTESADESIAAVIGAAIPDKTAIIGGDNSGAAASIGAVMQMEIPDKTAIVLGDNSAAVSAINTVNSMAVYDKYMTINVVTAYSTIGTPPGLGLRHGGIAGYAHGGVVAELGEAGLEMLHFANGGSVPVYDRGIYSIPEHTYVSPSNTRSYERSGGISVSFQGAVFNGTSRADMDAWAEQSFIPSLRRVIQDERRGQVS